MSTQRKAWNEAMKNAARGTMLPVIAPVVNRRSGRSSNKNKRREKARKVLNLLGDENGKDGSGAIDLVEFRIDALEEASNDLLNMVDDDEEYDELDDLEEVVAGGGSTKRKRKSKKSAAANKNQSGILPKRFKARTLASVLIEESTRGPEDGVLQQYLNAEAVRPSNTKARYPRRKFCSVTGLEALYKDPKSGIPFANLAALEQIRERPPPWISGFNNAGSATYYETIRSLKNEDT